MEVPETTHGYGHPFNYGNKPVARYIEIFADLAQHLPKGLSVTDLFGGVGTLAQALWPILEPRSWTSVELDPACVHLYKESRANVVQGDAFKWTKFHQGGVVIIDPHQGTLNAMAKSREWKGLLTAIKDSRARYILMQEYGAYWCHLPNQIKLYTELCGTRVDKKNYRDCFSDYMYKTYGFVVLMDEIGLGSCYYLMEIKR